MDADDQGGPAVLEGTGEVDAPERPRVIESLGHDLAGERDEVSSVTDRLRRKPNVAADVEARVVHPGGCRHSERGRCQALAEPADAGQPRLDPAANEIECRRSAVLPWLGDDDLQGVAADDVGLEPQDA